MKLDLGPVKDATTLPCGCVAVMRINGFDTIEPCQGHALQENGRAIVAALGRLEQALKIQTHAISELRRPACPQRRAGLLRRAWLWLCGPGY